MAININTISISGSILLCLGAITCVGGLALYLAVRGGIAPGGEGDHLHDTYFIIINGMRRMIFLLPLAAGIFLIASGLLLRGQIPFLNSMFTSISDQNQEAESGPRE